MSAINNDIYVQDIIGTKVEYLKSDGVAYINTGYKAKPNDTLEIEFSYDATPTRYEYVLGAYVSGQYGLGVFYHYVQGYEQFRVQGYDGVMFYDNSAPIVIGDKYKFTANIADSGFSGNTTLENSTSTWNRTRAMLASNISESGEIFLFARNSSSANTPCVNVRIYSFKVYSSGTLTHNFVPAKTVTGKGMFYDTVTGNVCKDASDSGEFTCGSVTDPEPITSSSYLFQNENIFSINAETAVALVGQELSIDTFTAEVQDSFENAHAITLFSPTDYNAIESSDNYAFGNYTVTASGIITMPYASIVKWYNNSLLKGIYYLSGVERTGANRYTINGISAIGLLDKQFHKGGLYSGTTLSTLLAEIIGDTIAYTVSTDVASTPIYGWLPYDTKRNNLYQVLFATNTNLIKTAQGEIIITKIISTQPNAIPSGNVFNSGSIEYSATVSKVDVNEHSFQVLGDESEETLFDNTAGTPVVYAKIIFDNAPIIVSSITATGLSIHESTVNYAIVSGQGELVGKPYTHSVNTLTRINSSASEENVVSCSDAYLVTSANSSSVLNRLYNYYICSKKSNVSIILSNERCGNRYTFENPFQENATGYLEKLSVNVSSFAKADCELIEDYSPYVGGGYSNSVLLTGNGIWTVPDGVTEIRAILISGGQGGSSGYAGHQGGIGELYSLFVQYTAGEGGAGGNAGNVGVGGRIRSEIISVAPGDTFSYSSGIGGSCGGENSSTSNVNAGSYGSDTIFGSYSTNGYYSSPTGFVDVFTGNVYGLPAPTDGVAGGKGGNGGTFASEDIITYSEYFASAGLNGESVSFGGVTYQGGNGGRAYVADCVSKQSGSLVGIKYVCPGGGGSGAVVGGTTNNGYHGSTTYGDEITEQLDRFNMPYWSQTVYPYTGVMTDRAWQITQSAKGADGCTPSARTKATTIGQGGYAGHGGSGGGGTGERYSYTEEAAPGLEVALIYTTNVQIASAGGHGGAGGDGADGGILIYY